MKARDQNEEIVGTNRLQIMQLIKYLGFRDFSKRENVLFALKRRPDKDTRGKLISQCHSLPGEIIRRA